jgi:glycerol uptake facilitator-like aquaporin
VRKFLRENSLTIFFGVLFLGALVGQAIAGHAAYNNDQLAHGEQAISLGRYVTSSAFANAVMENWQSEYLQFTLMMVATIWLLQRGSPESKSLDEPGLETKRDQRIGSYALRGSPEWAQSDDWRTAIYSNSLLILMGVIFLGAWFAQSVTGWTDFNDFQRTHHEATVGYWSYLGEAEFWEATLQNWQSEFLAVGSFAVFAIFLRQRGSPESKPVGAPHDATGVEG